MGHFAKEFVCALKNISVWEWKAENCSRVRETKETWKLNATCDSELDRFALKGIIGTSSQFEHALYIRW